MAMRWWVVSVPASEQPLGQLQEGLESLAQRIRAACCRWPADRPSTAAEALDRIELPQEARERISQLVSPGSM